jgi:hypothetical protein
MKNLVALGLILFASQSFAQSYDSTAEELSAVISHPVVLQELNDRREFEPIQSVTRSPLPTGTEFLIKTRWCALKVVVTYTNMPKVSVKTEPEMHVQIVSGICNQTGFSVGSH